MPQTRRHQRGSVRPADCAELATPPRSLLGPAQEQWLGEGLAADAKHDHTRWSVLAQQTLFSPPPLPQRPGGRRRMGWLPCGARERLLQSVQRHSPRNTVLLGGDIHQNYVCNVHAPGAGGDRPVLASEFCGTSISSRAGTTQDKVDAIARHNPHIAGPLRRAGLWAGRHHPRAMDDHPARGGQPWTRTAAPTPWPGLWCKTASRSPCAPEVCSHHQTAGRSAAVIHGKPRF